MKKTRDKLGRFVKGHTLNNGVKLSEEHKEKLSQAKLENPVRYWKGKERHDLNGKRIKRNSGYVYVSYYLMEEWVRDIFGKNDKRPVAEHRYLWVKHNKKPIPRGYVIHHINKDRGDNSISNLELMARGEHSQAHNKLNK